MKRKREPNPKSDMVFVNALREVLGLAPIEETTNYAIRGGLSRWPKRESPREAGEGLTGRHLTR